MSHVARARWWLVLLVVISLGTTLRFLNFDSVLTDHGVRLIGNDAYYHALRTERCVASYPSLADFDPGMNHPEGAAIPWPPLFDFTAATLAFAIGLTPGSEAFLLLLAVIPVICGGLSLAFLYHVFRRMADGSVAWRATLLVAVIPAHVSFSEFGRFDHHVLEVLFLSLGAGLLVVSLRSAASDASWRHTLMLCLWITLSFLNWSGSALLLFLLGLLLSVCFLLDDGRGRFRPVATMCWRASAQAALVLAAVILVMGGPATLFEVVTGGLNAFHVSCVCIFAVFAFLLCHAPARWPPARRMKRVLWVTASGAAPLLVALVIVPGFAGALMRGVETIIASGAWIRNIVECDPVFLAGHVPWTEEALEAAKLLGAGFFLLPITAILLVLRIRRSSDERLPAAGILAWGLLFILLTLASKRFAVYLSVIQALWLAILWVFLERKITSRIGQLPRWAASLMTLLFLVWPTFLPHMSKLKRAPGAHAEDRIASLSWLRTQTRPDHAVLAEWDLGHHVSYFARKPVVVTPFGTYLSRSAMEDCANFFQSLHPGEVAAMLARRKVGHIVLENPITEVHYSFGLSSQAVYPTVEVQLSPVTGRQIKVLSTFWNLLVSRLYFFDGMSRQGGGTPLTQFRLVHESATSQTFLGQSSKLVKIFEVVEGASVRLMGRPGTLLSFETSLRTNQGRTFKWKLPFKLDAEGRSSVRLPYATGENGSVHADPFILKSHGIKRRVEIKQTQVLHGSDLEIRL